MVYGTAAVDDGAAEIDLHLDVYAPAGDDRPDKPAVVLVHGGSFTGGSKSNGLMVTLGQLLAAQGFLAVSINYRLFGDDPPVPGWMQVVMDLFGITPSHPEYPRFRTAHAAGMDTRIAVRWLRENATALGIDPNRIAGIGSSAGAFCTLVAGTIDEPAFDFDRLHPSDPLLYPEQSPYLDATVDLWGTLAGFTDLVVDGDDSPLMIVHGTADGVVPYADALALAARATTVGLDHELVPLPGVGHGAPITIDVDGLPLSDRILDFLRTRLDLCRCGNASVEHGEDCDPASPDPCCSPTSCSFNEDPCDDGDACTWGDVCAAGTCSGTTGPSPTCRRTAPSRASLTLRDRDGIARDTLAWRWKKGQATSREELGDPLDATDYAICVFDGHDTDATLVLQSHVPAAQPCGAASCWRDRGARGFSYKDKTAAADGVRKIVLKPGDDFRSSITLDVRGADLSGRLPFASTPTLQLHRLDEEICWGAELSEIQRNDSGTLKARGD